MNELQLYQSREQKLIDDLAARMTILDPPDGATVLVSPENESYLWTTTYCHWISNTLSNMFPNVKFIIFGGGPERPNFEVVKNEN